MEANSRLRARRSLACEDCGQSTVEYALVLVAFLAMVLALGAVWETVGGGGLQRASEQAASHVLAGEGATGGLRDLVLF